jgi:hypothetical protein
MALTLGISALLAAGLPATVSAQEDDTQKQFNEAVELATNGYYDSAVETCLAILDRLPDSDRPRANKLLGYSYMKIEMFPEAWHHLSAYRSGKGAQDETAAEWLAQVETKLQGTYVRIDITCDVPDTVLAVPSSVDEEAELARPCPTVLWLVPGEHTLSATPPGGEPQTLDLNVRQQGDKGKRKLRLAPREPPPPVAPGQRDGAGTAGPAKEPVESPPPNAPSEPGSSGATVASETTEPPTAAEIARVAEHRNYRATEWLGASALLTTDGLGFIVSFLNFRWDSFYLELLRAQVGSSWDRSEKMVDGMNGSLGAGFGVPIHFGTNGRFELRIGLDLKAVAFHLTGDVKQKDWVKDADGLVGPGLALRGTFVVHPPAERWYPSFQIGLECLGILRLYPGPDTLDWKILPGLSAGILF